MKCRRWASPPGEVGTVEGDVACVVDRAAAAAADGDDGDDPQLRMRPNPMNKAPKIATRQPQKHLPKQQQQHSFDSSSS